MQNVIQELIDNGIVNEALISKDEIPKVDPTHPQNTKGLGPDSFGADGSRRPDDNQNPMEADKETDAETSMLSFQKHTECLTACLNLAEYHAECVMECKGLKEMENAVSERMKLAAQMLKTAREYVSEIQGGYVAQPQGSMPQPSSGNMAAQS